MIKTMEFKEGQFYYKPHRRSWGVWRRGKTDENGMCMDDFIADFATQVQAKDFVYKANHWLK